MATAASRARRRTAGATTPQGFTRDAARSYGDPQSDSAVIHGDNLDVMRRLAEAGYAGRFRCVYLDPPFNSGRRFAEYGDALSPAGWQTMMAPRLEAARDLLADDGAIFVEIDDTEVGPLQVGMDALFGRDQRIATVTVVRSAATGHKASNRGLVNVTDFILVYAKDRARWRCNQQVRVRDGFDAAYGTWLENPADPCDCWRFAPLVASVRGALGPGASRAASSASRWTTPSTSFASRSRGTRRSAGARRRSSTAPATSPHGCCGCAGPAARIWSCAPATACCSWPTRSRSSTAGACSSSRSPTSGTTSRSRASRARAAPGSCETRSPRSSSLGCSRCPPIRATGCSTPFWAVVRPPRWRTRWAGWIGIEQGDHVDALCLPRLRRVVDGQDATGVTRAYGWRGGGGFHVWA